MGEPAEWVRGNRVEIRIREEGFEDSLYPAFIVARFPLTSYLVRYATLVEEDEATPVREFTLNENIRPVPLPLPVPTYSPGDIVNAYIRDGWWKGRVTRRVGQLFEVAFLVGNERDFFSIASLRLHQRYNRNRREWVYSKAW